MENKTTYKLSVIEIYDKKGNDIIPWKNLLTEIKLNDENINYNIISKINQSLIEEKYIKRYIHLTISIIDFIIDYGNDNLIKDIASENFLRNFARLASKKSKLNKEDQKKNIIFNSKMGNKI